MKINKFEVGYLCPYAFVLGVTFLFTNMVRAQSNIVLSNADESKMIDTLSNDKCGNDTGYPLYNASFQNETVDSLPISSPYTRDTSIIGEGVDLLINESSFMEIGPIVNADIPDSISLTATKLISRFMMQFGSTLAMLPLPDTLFGNSRMINNYWLNTSVTIHNLPFQIGISTASGFDFSNENVAYPAIFNFSFDYRQYLANKQGELLTQLQGLMPEELINFKSFNISDSLIKYQSIKDTLSNAAYLLRMSHLRDQRTLIIDSINNCYTVDSTLLLTIDKTLNKYDSLRATFNQLATFQEYYDKLEKQYAAYQAQIQVYGDKIASLQSFDELMEFENDLELKLQLPQWPLSLKKINIGTQYISHTPLTFENYMSNGAAVEFENNNLILMADILTQKWVPGYSVITEQDSLFNMFNNNQLVYLGAAGFGSLDSNHIIFTLANIRERVQSIEDEVKYANTILSLFQRQNISENIFFSYEIAKSSGKIIPAQLVEEDLTTNQFVNQLGFFTQLTVGFPSINHQLSFEHSFTGLSYQAFGNSLLQPGMYNSSIGSSQHLWKNSLTLDYKVTYAKSLANNPVQSMAIYHTAMANIVFPKIGLLQFSYMPFRFNYAIADTDESESDVVSNMVNCFLQFNIYINQSTIATMINYSNFATQTGYLDTLVYLSANTLSFSSVGTAHGKSITFNGYFTLASAQSEYIPLNNIELMVPTYSANSIDISIGPKWGGSKLFNDQIGAGLSLRLKFKEYFFGSLDADKYFEIQHSQEKYYSQFQFNATFGLTIK